MSKAVSEFWDSVEDVRAGMLGLISDGRLVPMSPQVRDDVRDGKIWFITAQGTDLVSGVQSGPQDARFVIADTKEGLHADVLGTLEMNMDKSVLEDIWNVMAGAWFEGDKDDPDLRLLSFTPKSAEAWFSEDNPAKFLFEIAKAHMTDSKPDTGWQEKFTF